MPASTLTEQIVTVAAALVGGGGLIGLIKARGESRQQRDTSEAGLRGQLFERLDRMDARQDEIFGKLVECEEDRATMRGEIATVKGEQAAQSRLYQDVLVQLDDARAAVKESPRPRRKGKPGPAPAEPPRVPALRIAPAEDDATRDPA